jgi:hypothetical protein
MPNTLEAEDAICPACDQDGIECLENCTLHKCVHCDYSERSDQLQEGDFEIRISDGWKENNNA